MRTLIKVVAAVFGLLILLVIGAYWYLSTLDLSEYRDEIAAKVQAATGRELRLAGQMELKVFPSPSLIVEDVSLANAGWGSQPDFIRIKRVEAEASLAELLAGKLTIGRIAIFDPKVVLEVDDSGRNNWTLVSEGPAAAGQSDQATPLTVDVSHVEIHGGEIVYIDGPTKRSAMLGIDELRVVAGGTGKPIIIELIGKASVSNAAWGSQPEFASVGQVDAKLSMSDWSGGRLKVEKFVADRPLVFLETDGKGNDNWTFTNALPTREPAPAPEKTLPIEVEVIEVRDGGFRYRDGAAGTTRNVTVDRLQIEALEADRSLKITMHANVDGRAVSVDGNAGSLAALIGNQTYPFDLKINAAGAEILAVGRVQQPKKARGVEAKVEVTSPNVGELLGAFGTTSTLSLPLAASASVRDVEQGYATDNLTLSLGASDLSGNLGYVTASGRPQISASLESRLLNLDEISSRGPKQESGRVIPDEPLPVETLRSVDANISLKGAKVISGGVEISALTLDLKLRNGRLELTPRAGLYGGEFNGRADLDAAVERPRLDLDLQGRQINLGALVNSVNGSSVLSGGPTDIQLKLSGRGMSPREMAASADGRLLVTIGPGKIHTSVIEQAGADALMQAIRAASGERQSDYTAFQCGVARFTVEGGEAVTRRGIAVQNPRMNVVGSGTVNLDTEKVDIAIKTEPREGAGLSVSAVGLAIRVGGTLGNPETSLDSLGAAKAGASAAAAVATGGLSLLGQALFSRAAADDAPCDTALGIQSGTKKSSAKTESAASGNGQRSAGSASGGISGATDAVTDTLKGVGNKLKGLFGN